MPITVAFWNINTGQGSFSDRQTTFDYWCQNMPVDLLFLEEVSFTMSRDHLGRLTGMTQLGRVATLDKNDNPSTKDLVAMGDPDDYNARELRFPNLESKRMLLKVTDQNAQYDHLSMWCIHANASKKGGKEAVKAVNDHMGKPSGQGAVVGGDFNCPIGLAGARTVAPLGYDGIALQFTQWNKTGGQTPINGTAMRDGTQIQLKNAIGIQYKFQPHNIIDYVMHGIDRTVVAQPNCPDQATWTNILRFFDHCPVVYQITG